MKPVVDNVIGALAYPDWQRPFQTQERPHEGHLQGTPSSGNRKESVNDTQPSGCTGVKKTFKDLYCICLCIHLVVYPDTNRVIYGDDDDKSFIIQNRRRLTGGRCGAFLNTQGGCGWIRDNEKSWEGPTSGSERTTQSSCLPVNTFE